MANTSAYEVKYTSAYEVKYTSAYEVKYTTPYEVKYTTPYEVKYTTPYEVNYTTPYEVNHVIQVPVYRIIAATCPIELSLAIMSGGGRPTDTNVIEWDLHPSTRASKTPIMGQSHEILMGDGECPSRTPPH